MIVKMNTFDRSEGGEHVQRSLLRYLDYDDKHYYNVSQKWFYQINRSKVSKFQKGHVIMGHPIITFLEGTIPRNSYHNTLAFRMSIELVRSLNTSKEHKAWETQ
jgi:hypothetical protein